MVRSIVRYSKYVIGASVVAVIIMVGLVVRGQMMGMPHGMSDANDRLLCRLDSLLPSRQERIEARERQIDSVARVLDQRGASMPPAVLYARYKQLFMDSHLLRFSYSLQFPQRMAQIADTMHDPARKAEAQVYLAYSLGRGGFFKEAMDSLCAIRIDDTMPDSTLAAVYLYGGRIWHDMADYADMPAYSARYKQKGNQMLRMALPHIESPVAYLYVQGKILLWQDRLREARPYYDKALRLCTAHDVEYRSILLSTLASIDRRQHHTEQATGYYLQAVYNDVDNAIVETVAIKELAQLFFDEYQDAYRSSSYLMAAMDNARHFGTRYRINAMGTLVPIFQQQKELIDHSRRTILTWAVAVFLLLVVALMVVLYQNMVSSKRLGQSRDNLADVNQQLADANHIKNEYLGYYMGRVSDLVTAIDNFSLVAEQKINLKQEQALQRLIRQLHDKYSKKMMKEEFDHSFMLLFPTFVDGFNELMTNDGKQYATKEGALTPVLRIFALIRLGISDNNEIARVLDYSFNTVYNYRVRTRNKALVPAEFEAKILKIGM